MSKRKIALLLSFLYFFVIIFSAAFIALEINHDCAGEYCPICGKIILYKSKQFSNFFIVLNAFTGFLVFILLFKNQKNFLMDFSRLTPVTLKIKLSN